MRWTTVALGAGLAVAVTASARDARAALAGWFEGFGNGVILNEVQPGTSTPCDSSHECEVTASGNGQGTLGAPKISFGFTADFLDDLTTSSSNATGGKCHPAGGSVTLSIGSDSLVLDFEGQHCAIGGDFSRSVITGTYQVDGGASTGSLAGASGAGSFSWSNIVGNSSSDVILSLSGNVKK